MSPELSFSNADRRLVDSYKRISLSEAERFCNENDIENRLGFNTTQLLIFRYNFAGYYARKSPEAVKAAGEIRKPFFQFAIKTPILSYLARACITVDDSYNLASQELFIDAEYLKEISIIAARASEQLLIVMNSFKNPTNELKEALDGLQESAKNSSESYRDSSGIKGIANMCTFVWMNAETEESKKGGIDGILSKYLEETKQA